MTICLVILDGWGHNIEKVGKDAIEDSNCKNMRYLSNRYLSYLIHASGKYVGLNDGCMGNSEVGHLTLGSGRIIKQNIAIIDEAFSDQSIKRKLQPLFDRQNRTLHLIGMLSDGGIHSHIRHLKGLVLQVHKNFDKINIHCISDGRDTAPNCFIKFFEEMEMFIKKYDNCFLTSVGGRYFGMDRDNNEERIDKYFLTLTNSNIITENIRDYIKDQYKLGRNDETILPAIFFQNGKISSEDSILFFNFRADRMRQITKKFVKICKSVFTLTEYDKNVKAHAIFRSEVVPDTLADILEYNEIEQVHIAETEKYAHVTYFFNGGNEKLHKKEERIIIDSKKIEKFDDDPEMSSELIANEIIKQIRSKKKFIVSNFAAPDMVGHTGNYEATKKAINFIDKQIGKIYEVCKKENYTLVITADHGNAELMYDEINNDINKKHTCNKVPLIITAGHKDIQNEDTWGYENSEFSLQDVAPTILKLLKIKKSTKMTGKNII